MMRLIDKTRTLNRLLQRTGGMAVSFMEMAELLRDLLQADSYVFSRRGKRLGRGILVQSFPNDAFESAAGISPELNSLLFSVRETITDQDRDQQISMVIERIKETFA